MVTTVDSRRETVSLIGSDKVESTLVYGADDQKIGTVQRVMIDKISGKVAYAVISFGGFLGMGEDYFPMPWASLKRDTNLGGYRVGVTEDQLKGAPKYNRNSEWDWSDRSRDKVISDYYRAPLCRGKYTLLSLGKRIRDEARRIAANIAQAARAIARRERL